MNRELFVAAAVVVLTFGLGTVGCQEVEQPSPVLTEKQWNKVKKNIYDYAHDEDPPDDVEDPDQAPKPEYEIGANYQDKIEFIGFSVGDPDKNEPLRAGETVTFRWYWRAKEDIDKNWTVFVHFDSKDTSVDAAKRRQNLDHDPLDGLFPTSKWPKGKVIEDTQKVDLRADYPAGPAVPHVGFFRGQTRLSIKNDVPQTEDNRVKAPSLEVKNPGGSESSSDKGGSKKPTYAANVVETDSSEFNIDGELSESVWSDAPALTLSPFGSGPDKESKIRVVRNDSHLLVGAHLHDEHVWSSKKERDSNTWSEEVVEMFIDVDGDGSNYLELQVNPLGTIFDANFKERLGTGKGSRRDQIDRAKKFDLEGLESGVHVEGTVNDSSDEDSHWSVELKIPLGSIPGVEEGAEDLKTPWAVNFYRFDRPGGKDGERTLSYAWSTEARGDFHQVDKFGELTFGSEGGDSNGNEKPNIDEINEALKKGPKRVPPGQKLDPKNLKQKAPAGGAGSE